MDFQWVAIALGDVAWISLALALGLLSRSIGLPPLVGFLATGFILNAQGIVSGAMLQKLADLGITLLLFTVGLKLNLRSLARPQIWAVSGLHMAATVLVFGFAIYGIALIGTPFVSELDLSRSLLIAFALSFSSTVFVVKVLEEKGEMGSLHGRLAVGILIMQDLAAVAFLAVSAGKLPSLWALLIVLLIPLRPLLLRLLVRVGHGELMILYGLLLALGGAEAFELVGLKGDLGALVLGILVASHPKAEELAKSMLGLKDLFLLGFFLSIGLAGQPTLTTVFVGVLITPLIFAKSALFFGLLTRFKLRARTSVLTSLNLTNYSEFGLIVAAIGVAQGWIDADWMIALAIALSLSFAVAAGLDAFSHALYNNHRGFWQRWQRTERLADDLPIDIAGARTLVVGMGSIGSGAYDSMREEQGKNAVVGVDTDPVRIAENASSRRRVLLGDPADSDFWDRVQDAHTLELVMIALPKLSASLAVIEQLKAHAYQGRIAATARFPDQVTALEAAGADTVFSIYAEAGAGFVSHVVAKGLA